ncbi:MAG TPA: hypothetical protein DDZ88_27215 [Verrucomicrobiales bacterium]|nr:hypothetical protein [Verrucomicrobiales bacterium]
MDAVAFLTEAMAGMNEAVAFLRQGGWCSSRRSGSASVPQTTRPDSGPQLFGVMVFGWRFMEGGKGSLFRQTKAVKVCDRLFKPG